MGAHRMSDCCDMRYRLGGVAVSKLEKEECDEQVRGGDRWPRHHRCCRPVFEDGKCKIHCASAQKARAAKSQAKYEEKNHEDRMRRANWFRKEFDKYPLELLKTIRDEITVELEKRK